MDTKSKSKQKAKKAKRDSQQTSEDNDVGDLILDVDSTPPKSKQVSKAATSSNTTKKRKKRDSASSDEERWLTAIESGKLEDVDDELKKIKPKDPSLMTARQRAMYDRTDNSLANSTLISLPTGYKEKVMTPEAIQKAAIKSQKRKQLADEKREKDKKKTMERLLKKQESKSLKLTQKSKQSTSKNNNPNIPLIIYKQNVNGTYLTVPPNLDLSFNNYAAKQAIEKLKKRGTIYCSMNCGNMKKYSCSKTNVPLCSLQCYKKNIEQIIC